MSETEETEETEESAAAPKSKKGLIIGLVLALALGGGAFFAVYSGMVLGHPEEIAETDVPLIEDTDPVAFVAITPMVISLGKRSNYQLRFNAQLEVEPSKQADVENVMPRVLDVLNGYLRAVDVRELQDPTALIRLRAQMLRRVQLVTGDGHIRDLLITEFVFT